MPGIKLFELYTVPQDERVKKLGDTIDDWLIELGDGEQLVVGIPAVLGKWDEAVIVVLNPGMRNEFAQWLFDSAEHIKGPVYNLPRLTASFLCLTIDSDFDPRLEGPPDQASPELMGVLTGLARVMDKQEAKAA